MCPVFHNVIVIAVLGKNFKILRAGTASEFCKIFQEPKTSHYKKKKKKAVWHFSFSGGQSLRLGYRQFFSELIPNHRSGGARRDRKGRKPDTGRMKGLESWPLAPDNKIPQNIENNQTRPLMIEQGKSKTTP